MIANELIHTEVNYESTDEPPPSLVQTPAVSPSCGGRGGGVEMRVLNGLQSPGCLG